MTRGWNAFVPASLWGRHLLALTSLRLEEAEAGVGDVWGSGGFTEMQNWLLVMTIEIFLGGAEHGDEWRQTFTLEACLHLKLK